MSTIEHADPRTQRAFRRPQRMHTWFSLIPLAEYESEQPREVLFLDTFVRIEPPRDPGGPHRVLFEGDDEMTVVERFGMIFVWYGTDLSKPDREFPTFFADPYPTAYVSSPPTIFNNTHVMDFVENGSDNLHFKSVHLWEYSKIYDHEISDTEITLLQDTRFKFGACSTQLFKRLMSKVLPTLELTQDYVYHGPTLAVVGASGKGTPDMHALVSLTPEGADRTRVYVTIALAPDTFPPVAEGIVGKVTPNRSIADRLAGVMAGYIQNEFDIDAIIWANRSYSRTPRLLPAERHLQDVINWGETFYPPEFEFPEVSETRVAEPTVSAQWRALAPLAELSATEVATFEVSGTPVVARLAADGSPIVHPAHCPHQGAHLGFGGTIENGCMRCPFHGFYWDDSGNCHGRNSSASGSAIEELELVTIDHRILDGWVEIKI